MKDDRSAESPALRLGVLYVASFFTIALLSGISQAYILRELSWQSRAISSVARSARQRSLDDSLSVRAMAMLAAADPRERAELEASLRNAIGSSEHDFPGTVRRGAAFWKTTEEDSKAVGLEHEAETHRRLATEAAESLLLLVQQNQSGIPLTAESAPLVRNIIAHEDARSRASGEAAQAIADEVGRSHPATRVVRVHSVRAGLGRARRRRASSWSTPRS